MTHRRIARRCALVLATAATLAGCAGGERGLHQFSSSGNGPDAFAAMPARPLDMPQTSTLPAPTPGAVNRADRDPVGEGIAALGGTRSTGGIPASDAGLIAQASRNGTAPGIRATLAQEDAALRSRSRTLSAGGWLRGSDRYFRTYARQALDADAEAARFRAAGVPTPSAPPGN
ncbi:DUF3035 domain-containing protein [Poseidonocella sedimentorum]|nr:DUF3035 domain-containing protein [Poseidonocella sedimentorum]